jgi:hypothetical protein
VSWPMIYFVLHNTKNIYIPHRKPYSHSWRPHLHVLASERAPPPQRRFAKWCAPGRAGMTGGPAATRKSTSRWCEPAPASHHNGSLVMFHSYYQFREVWMRSANMVVRRIWGASTRAYLGADARPPTLNFNSTLKTHRQDVLESTVL